MWINFNFNLRKVKMAKTSKNRKDSKATAKPKAEKKEKPTIEYGANYIAEQLGIEGRAARIKLRAMGYTAKGGRYDFSKTDADAIIAKIQAKKAEREKKKEKKKGKDKDD